MKSSTALPLLPSARAKLESKAVETSQSSGAETISTKSAGSSAKSTEETNAAPISRTGRSPRIECPTQTIDELEERSEQLNVLHQLEQNVFGQHPPLEPSVTCEAVHQYLATTSQFLNSFIADANASLEGTSHKLTVLEKQMAILETKLVSIPGLFPDEDDEKKEKE